jgi:nucleoside phosphorylase/ActR/RegA family two-component response regulator
VIKTLVVEDNADKRLQLARALGGVSGFPMEQVVNVSNVYAAQQALRTERFEFLILDIALPRRADDDIHPQAGLHLLEELEARPDWYHTPSHIVGITGYEDIYQQVAGRFSSRLVTLIRYADGDSEWEHALKARAAHILNAALSRNATPLEYLAHAAILCALDSPELTSVLDLPAGWVQETRRGDHSIYWRGTIPVRGQDRTVYAASAAYMGMPATAVLSMKMIQAFRPKFLAMCGITGGIRDRVQIGDLIASDPCWDWGSGKWVLEGDAPAFQAAPRQFRLPGAIREPLRILARDSSLLQTIRDGWQSERPAHDLRLHIGPSASGASVLSDGVSARRIIEQHRELIGIEMEGYAVFAAAEEAPEPQPSPLVIKGVVDFADTLKNDRFQRYAAYTSARLLWRILQQVG